MERESNAAFVNLNEWATELRGNAPSDTNDCCVPLVLELISRTEAFPTPDEMNGIDLKRIYGVLANLMAGYPVEELDPASKEFLKGCYKVNHA